MKKTFTLFAALLLVVIMNAAHSQSRFSISSVSKSAIRVMIDGNRYNVIGNTLMINNLRPGFHSVKIYRQNRGVKSNQFSNNYQLVYSARVNVRPQYHADITINRFGKAFYDERPISYGYNNDDDWTDHDPNHDDWNNDNNNWDTNNDFNANRPMNAQSFERFKMSLKNESFDETRSTIAKQVISTNWFTTVQVKEVLGFFPFENSKLDIAKYAFKFTVNRGDYFMLADEFSFSSNKEELMRYIQANQ